MENIRRLITVMVAILTISTAHAENLNTNRSNRSKDPWQIMQETLNNHYYDTTGLSVKSPVTAKILSEIVPDLQIAYHVKGFVDLSQATMLGDVICAFMRVKYAGRKGETYDYYKLRYCPTLLYAYYLEEYPNSPYATEMRLKMECIDQCLAWEACESLEDCIGLYAFYGPSYCPYKGFSNIAIENNLIRESIAMYSDDYSLREHSVEPIIDNINVSLVAPYNKIGFSSFFVGNVGRKFPFSFTFIGPTVFDVVLEPGQHQWVELENGEYEVKFTSSNGYESWPYGNGNVTIEDGVYTVYWSDDSYMQPFVFSENECIDDEIAKKMFHDVMERIVSERSDFSLMDYETSRTLLMHYIRKLYSDVESQEELEELYREYTDRENIEDTINTIWEVFQSYAKEDKESDETGLFKL